MKQFISSIRRHRIVFYRRLTSQKETGKESVNKSTNEAVSHEGSSTKKSSSFSSYTQAINHSIGDIERVLMDRIHESNKRRFRIVFFSTVFGIFWFFAVFGGTISKKLRSLTTGLALETLEDKSIKIQTQELAMAVVQTVLNDKEVTAQAAAFLREASHTPETQEALLQLTLHVLQHPDSVQELSVLTKRVVAELANDKETIRHIGELLCEVFNSPLMMSRLSALVGELCQDKEVYGAVSDLAVKVAAEPPVVEAVNELLLNSANYVLNDEEV